MTAGQLEPLPKEDDDDDDAGLLLRSLRCRVQGSGTTIGVCGRYYGVLILVAQPGSLTTAQDNDDDDVNAARWTLLYGLGVQCIAIA